MTADTPKPAIAVLLLFASAVAAEGTSYRGAVRKVFQRHCVVCHNTSRASADLDLSTYEGVLAGGSSGEAVVAGSTEDSYLYLVTAHEEEPVMPPGADRVPDEDLAILRRWIELGLPETDADVVADGAVGQDTLPGSMSAAEPPLRADVSSARSGPVVAVSVSDDADRLAVGRQLAIELYEASTERLMAALPFPEGEPRELRFTSDGRWLIAAGGEHGKSGAVVVWSIDGARPVRVWRWNDAYDAVLTADLSPDRRRVVVGDSTRRVRIISTESRGVMHSFNKPTDWVLRTRFGPDGLLVAAADRDGGVYVWETDSGALLHSLRGHKDAVVALEWTADGDRLVTASYDGDVRLWDMHTGGLAGKWEAHQAGVVALAFEGQGAMLTAGRRGDRLVRWDTHGKRVGELAGLPGADTTAVTASRAGVVWLGTLAGDLAVANKGQGLARRLAPQSAPPSLALAVDPVQPTVDATVALQITPVAAQRGPSAQVVSRAESDALRMIGAGGTEGLDNSWRAGAADLAFERGVRSARLVDAVGELERIERALASLKTKPTQELNEAMLLLGLARERLEMAAETEAEPSDEGAWDTP